MSDKTRNEWCFYPRGTRVRNTSKTLYPCPAFFCARHKFLVFQFFLPFPKKLKSFFPSSSFALKQYQFSTMNACNDKTSCDLTTCFDDKTFDLTSCFNDDISDISDIDLHWDTNFDFHSDCNDDLFQEQYAWVDMQLRDMFYQYIPPDDDYLIHDIYTFGYNAVINHMIEHDLIDTISHYRLQRQLDRAYLYSLH